MDTNETPEEDLSVEAAVARAFDASDSATDEGAPAAEPAESVDVPSLADAPADDKVAPAPAKTGPVKDPVTGKFTKTAAAKPSVSAPTPAQQTETPKPAPAVTTETPKPPQSWKANVREKWSTLPAEVQQEVARRERETALALDQATESRRFHDSFKQVIAPYEGMIRAEGSDPMRAVGSLLQTAAALRTAPPAHRAQVIASMVKAYGVPIEDLDAALSGQAIPQGQPQGQYQDPRVDQLLQAIQQNQQRQMQSVQQRSQAQIQSLAQGKEFFEDVREDMADIMEVAGRRGVAMTLEQAYDRACKLHPEVSAALAQREAAKSVANAQASTQRTKAAASSVRSQPAVAVKLDPKDGERLEDTVAAAFAAHNY